MIKKTPAKASNILRVLTECHNYLKKLAKVDLLKGNLKHLGGDIRAIYDGLRKALGPTATSKLTHILNDGLFVM